MPSNKLRALVEREPAGETPRPRADPRVRPRKTAEELRQARRSAAELEFRDQAAARLRGARLSPELRRAATESFGLHALTVLQFLLPSNARDDQMLAVDLCPEWPPEDLEDAAELKRAGRQLRRALNPLRRATIMLAEADVDVPWLNERLQKMYGRLRRECRGWL